MLRKLWLPAVVGICLLLSATIARATQMEIYGAWHCGNDFCTWGTVRNMTNFDTANHWMIDRGDGTPSVNLVVLSFVNPLKLLNQTNDSQTVNGAPIGMNSAVVSYFTSHNIRVMLSIGGITYTSDWDTALSSNGAQLGTNAANLAKQLGVGIEIDYENNTSPNLTALQSFINAYRAILPYDATGANPAARLTIDLAAGDQYLVPLAAKATTDWLNTSAPVLDYANAMVPNKQPHIGCRVQLAATHQRLSADHAASAATGSRENDWEHLHRHRQKSCSRVHDLQQFARRIDWNVRGNGCSGRRGEHAGNVGHDVLGCGVPGRTFHLHHSSELLPGRRGRGVKDV